ncbi:LOW QUALITY PROTEIN: uncharacterized protein LOC121387743 [Gigantopelta aegis]|uniref:LOW QUALITY PROTEIN: uncharacterized protein LOC121387743 n=1 Tax=Gigantopelta aegis TaxID=1735272 RepID=UPI001B8874BA|nr:LOW QUALITY PROTEIN: uncharacterized protein LOC121387743 [Gigantopelta aegis]
MAERRIQTRTGRRDRFRGSEATRGGVEHHRAEIKRRSRSEGPHNRVSRPKEEESFESYPKNEKIVGPIWAVTHSSTATRVSRHSPPLSDDGGFVHVQEVAGSDSDSTDSDRKVWTKNPLIVRKTRRTGRSEKRQSHVENGFSVHNNTGKSSNRESYVYYGSGQDKSDSSGTGSLKGNKYQKLEELRRRRIDIQVTSDEEVQSTPASRISRLRQRAIQSGLGKQDSSVRHSAIEPSRQRGVTSNTSSSQSFSQKPSGVKNLVSSVQNGNTVSQVGYSNRGQIAPTNVKPAYQVSSSVPSQQVVAPKSFQHSSRFVDNSSQNQNKPYVSSQKAKRQSYEIKPFDQKGFSDSGISHQPDLPANFTVHSQNQHNVSEPKSAFTKSAYSTSPEVVPKRFFDRPRVPSADSIYDGVFDDSGTKQNIGRPSAPTYHNVGHGFVYMRPASRTVMELPKGDMLMCPPAAISNSQMMSVNSNEVVELRLKTNRVLDHPPPSMQGTPAKLVMNRVNSDDDDSLDELIESNIQYLDREIDRSRKKTATQVTKSASLPDPRHFSQFQMQESGVIVPVRSELKIPFASQSQGLAEWKIPNQPHISRGTELQFHIPVGSGAYLPPEIFIADENRPGSFSSIYSGISGQTNGQFSGHPGNVYGSGSLHPGSVASGSSHGSGTIYPNSHAERKLSYDSRAIYTLPGSEFHDRDMSKSDTQLNSASTLPMYRGDPMNVTYNQPYSSSTDQLVHRSGLTIPSLDRGMFSDVEYNIEVSDRVKKWEKYMQKRSETNEEALTTIQEQDFFPRDVRRSVFLDQRLNIPESPTMSMAQNFVWSGVSLKPSSSDPMINLSGDSHMFAKQTNRIVIQEPMSGAKYHTTNTVSSIFMPGPQRASPGLMSAADLRKHMVANKQPMDEQQIHALTNQNPNPVNCRYQELDELQEAKSETVRDLCKMFDISFQNEGQLMPCEEKPARLSPSQADGDTNWTQLISDLETKIKETEVWSPEMESQEGDLVSIERVKARTLQTIPFSEDPFWKEIEEMTSFEKLFKPEEFDSPLAFRAANPIEFASSQSNTLPAQPRISARDRITRSKSLYTPNITPLTISVDKYNGPNALDDVLEDIRVSLEKQSPKVRKGGDSSDSHRSSPGPPYTDLHGMQRSRSNVYWERKPETSAVTQSQGLLTYANPTQPEAKLQDSYPGMEQYPNVVNGNYQLDPDILKQKLLRTGLVDEQRQKQQLQMQQSSRLFQHRPSPLIIPRPPQFYAPAPQPLVSQPIYLNRPSEEKRNEVNQSMEELRQLAQDVEKKVGMIKSKIVRADENNLDKILLTLKKFAPTMQTRSPEPRPDSFEDFYVKKKSKLSEALFELDKIYNGLDLDENSMVEHARREDYPSYKRPSPIGQQKQDDKPEQTSSITFQVSKPSFQKPQQRTDSDIDAIQRSFQAILDEVNQAPAVKMVSSSASTSVVQPGHPTSTVKTVASSLASSIASQRYQTSIAKTQPSSIPTTIIQPRQMETLSSKTTVVSSFQQVERSPEVKRRNIVSSAKSVFQPFVPSVQTQVKTQPQRKNESVVQTSASSTAVSSKVVDMSGSKQNATLPLVTAQVKMPAVSSLKTKVPPETSPKPKRQNLQARTSRGVSAVTLTPAPALVPPETSPKPKRQVQPKSVASSSTTMTLSSSPTVVHSSATVSMPRPKPPGQSSASHIPTRQVTLPKTSSTSTTESSSLTSSVSSLDTSQRDSLAANVSKLMHQSGTGGPQPQSQSVSITLKTPVMSSSSVGPPANAASMQTSKSPRERRSRGRFRSKNPDIVEDDVAVRKARSKSTPRIDTQTSSVISSPTSADYLNPRESTPPQSRMRIRPEKEADLMHDDLAYRNLRKDVTIDPPKLPTTTACSAIEIELKSPVNSAASTPQTKPKFNKTVDLSKVKNSSENSSGSSPTVDSPKLKTVETQTSADERKSSRSRFSKRQDGKRKMGRGIAMMLEIFSSSDDDRRMRPLHTRSAPDLSLVCKDDDDGDDEDADDEQNKTEIVSEVHVTSSSCQSEAQNEFCSDSVAISLKQCSTDCSENVSEVPSSPTAPTNHQLIPRGNRSEVPEKNLLGGFDFSAEKNISNVNCENSAKVTLRTKQGRSSEREVQSDTAVDKSERPKSFHELLANFEQDENRRHMLRNLRKCASVDAVAMETVVKKAYQSEPYHSEPDLRLNNLRIPSQEVVQSWRHK